MRKSRAISPGWLWLNQRVFHKTGQDNRFIIQNIDNKAQLKKFIIRKNKIEKHLKKSWNYGYLSRIRATNIGCSTYDHILTLSQGVGWQTVDILLVLVFSWLIYIMLNEIPRIQHINKKCGMRYLKREYTTTTTTFPYSDWPYFQWLDTVKVPTNHWS